MAGNAKDSFNIQTALNYESDIYILLLPFLFMFTLFYSIVCCMSIKMYVFYSNMTVILF